MVKKYLERTVSLVTWQMVVVVLVQTLTDKNWILGGGIKNVFKTISEGGRSGKGMISWKQEV